MTRPYFSVSYAITRDITLRYFTPVLVFFVIIWTLFITLINVIAVGYDTASVTSTNFSTSNQLWYEKFIPASTWMQKPWVCTPATIRINDGSTSLSIIFTDCIKEIVPYSGWPSFTLLSYVDGRNNTPVDGMEYADYSLRNCSISEMVMGQWSSSAATTEVLTQLCN
jgi:hypothetical protein